MKENTQFERNINPEKSSIREEILELIETDNGAYLDKESGEIFHKIKKFPETQRFVSLLLKGVINVSDIVEYNGEYFSHEQNIEKLNSSEPFSEDEINADRFILSTIFNDSDHYKSIFTDHRNNINEWNKIEYYNLAIDKNTNKKYYYDFGAVEFEYPNIKTPAQLEEYTEMIRKYLQRYKPEELSIVHKKVGVLLQNLFNKNDYEHFKAIVERSNLLKAWESNKVKYDLNQTKDNLVIKDIFNDLHSRLDIVYKVT